MNLMDPSDPSIPHIVEKDGVRTHFLGDIRITLSRGIEAEQTPVGPKSDNDTKEG